MFNKLNNPRQPADPQKAALVAKQSRVLLALEDLARNNKPLQSLETADDQDIFGSCRYYYRERLHWHQTPPVLPTSENDLSLRRLIHKVMDCQVDSGIIMHTEFEVRRALVEAAAPGAIAARLMDTYEIADSTFLKYQHRFYEALFPDSVKAYNWSAVKELYKSQQTLVVRVASSFSLTKPGGRPKSNNTNRPQKLHGTMLNATAYTSVVENMDRLVWQNPDRVADFANSSAVVSSVSVTETHGIAGEQQTTMGTNTILRPDSVMLETMEKRSVVSASVLRKVMEQTQIKKRVSIKKRKALTETTNAAAFVGFWQQFAQLIAAPAVKNSPGDVILLPQMHPL